MRGRTSCHLCGILIGALVVFPGVYIFGDRSLPFEYMHTFNRPDTARPGDSVATVFTITKVKRECQGEFDRVFIDSAGKIFYMGTFPTIYHYNADSGSTRTFTKEWRVPKGDAVAEDAAPGKGVYRSVPRFWCNPIQRAYPIEAPPLSVPLVVLPR